MRVLVINRHALAWTVGPQGDYLPAEPTDRFLITRTFGSGLAGHSPLSLPNVFVLDMDDMDHVADVARWVIRNEHVDALVALHEKDMLMAAQLREDFGLPGMTHDRTLRFRDKALMKRALADAGYDRLPRFRVLEPGKRVRSVPWPGKTVVKSRWGVGSSQVRIADDVEAIADARTELERAGHELEIEEFVDGEMYHCDAVVHDREVLFAAACRYVGRPGDYGPGRVAGSVLVSDDRLRARLLAENDEVLGILGMESGVTHAEFFRRPSGDLVFCEVAARPGGGGIDEIVRRGYGVELIRAAVALQCGIRPDLDLSAATRAPKTIAGVVGIYHSADGRDRDASSVESLPGVEAYEFAAQEVSGVVRHCTDYAHKIIVEASTDDEFDARVRAVVDRIRAGEDESGRKDAVAEVTSGVAS